MGIWASLVWAQRLTPWTPEGNLAAIVEHGHTYSVPDQKMTSDGMRASNRPADGEPRPRRDLLVDPHLARSHRLPADLPPPRRGVSATPDPQERASNRTRIARRRAEEERAEAFFRPASDDEVGGSWRDRAGECRAADLQEKSTERVETELILRHALFVGFDEDGGSPANFASERSEPFERASGERSNQTQ